MRWQVRVPPPAAQVRPCAAARPRPLPPSRWQQVLGKKQGRETLHYAILDCRWPVLLCILVRARDVCMHAGTRRPAQVTLPALTFPALPQLLSYLAAAAVFWGVYAGVVSAGGGSIYNTQSTQGDDMPLAEAAWRLSITALVTLGYADVVR